jgi:hypothetical protein
LNNSDDSEKEFEEKEESLVPIMEEGVLDWSDFNVDFHSQVDSIL